MTRFQMKRYLIGLQVTALAVASLGVAPASVDAAFPGDNGKILFTTNRHGSGQPGTGEIYSMNADGTGQTRLTDNSVHDDDASWSPDGTKIVYLSAGDIYVMNADGSAKTVLAQDPALDTNPSWSPNGQKILFSSYRDGEDEIYVMDADGTNVTQLTFNNAIDDEANWSPDGTRISFTSARDGNAEIYVMNADGSNQTNLTNDPAYQADADWSPDSSKLTYESLGQINVLNADGTGHTTLPLPAVAGGPVWSPDGQKIAFAMESTDGWFDIFQMNADGTGPIDQLTTDSWGEIPTDWQALGGPVDTTDPSVTCDTPAPAFVLGGSHAADVTATVSDADSGPADASIEADVTAGDVSSVGVKSKSLTGYDNAGNSTTVSCPYVVGYGFDGFLAPLPASKNKAGSTIPVKFALTDAAGAAIADADAQALVGDPCRIEVTFAGQTQSGCPTYDPVANVFKFDLKTTKKAPKGLQTITVTISAPDGSGVLQAQSIQVVIV